MQQNIDRYTKAVAVRERALVLYTEFMRARGEDEAPLDEIRTLVPPGLYEHWKSKPENAKFYVVFGAGAEQDVHTPQAYYAALYAPRAGRLTARNLIDESRGFLTPVDRDGYRGPRFTLIEELDEVECAVLKRQADWLARSTQALQFIHQVKSVLERRMRA